MRTLHFCRRFSPLTETFIYDQIIAQASHGSECQVVCLERVNTAERPFATVHQVSIPGKTNPKRVVRKLRFLIDPKRSVSTYLDDWSRSKLPGCLEEIRPDVVHAHFGPAGVLIAPVAAAHGIPLVVSFYGFDATKLIQDPLWTQRYRRELFPHAAGFGVLTGGMADQLARSGAPREKLRIIRLAKDLGDFPYREPDSRIERWISVGRMTEKKGHLDCIRAFDRLATRSPRATLTIVGGGDLLEQTRQAAANARNRDRIALLGAVAHESTRRLMQQSDAFILCSKRTSDGDEEGTPTVLLEAQALGLPCVSTRHAGIPQCIPLENHWLLANEGDVKGIAERMAALSQCTAEELAPITRAGRKQVENEFTIEGETARLQSWYDEVTSLTVSARTSPPALPPTP